MNALLPVLILMTSFLPAIATFFLPQRAFASRNALNLGGAVLKLSLVAYMLWRVSEGDAFEARLNLAPGLYLLLRVDELALLFITLSAFLWLITTIYAIAYLADSPNQSRFFGFFSLCVAATTGIAMSGGLITFFIFYELLTLSTWPLVIHKQNKASIAAGISYLRYAMPGSAALLVAIVWLESSTGPIEFTRRGDLGLLDDISLTLIFALFIGGLGVKAALIPLHGWLPKAMAAPAPVSALLHAVAVVKAGAFGIVRVLHDVYGVDLVRELGVGLPLAILASATILWGSIRALQQVEVKKRLAYSTVSQVSYIVLGAALVGPLAAIGALAHLVHQGLMKITLFFCAGIYEERAGITRIDGLDGIGPQMPWTSASFTLGAMGMIGLPPMAGFVSKIYLGRGALETGQPWVLAVLAGSALLNAAYFLPPIWRLWFAQAPAGLTVIGHSRRANLALIGPAVIAASAALAVGLLAAAPFSPLGWATLIVSRNYAP